MSKILIVDDEQDIAELISDVLTSEGFNTITKNNGKEAIEIVKKEQFDLILLDIMMPEMSGIDACKIIRETVTCPIIFITAKTQLDDKIEGFNVGADDYITKPFEIEELIARVKAHIRRDHRTSNNNIITIGEITLNKESNKVTKNNKVINLSTKEFDLLSYLMTNAGETLSKEEIYNSVWKTEYGDIGTVAVNIKMLRNKIDPEEKYIITIWGLGYKFVKNINV